MRVKLKGKYRSKFLETTKFPRDRYSLIANAAEDDLAKAGKLFSPWDKTQTRYSFSYFDYVDINVDDEDTVVKY